MKLTILLIIGFMMTVSANSYSQKTKLDINLTNTTIKDLFGYIELHSEFIFLYRSEDFNTAKKVNIKVKEATINQILEEALRDEKVAYDVYERQVVIRKAGEPAVNSQQPLKKEVSGRVIDAKGQSIPGATVMIKGTTIGISTDQDGQFKLTVPADAKILVFSFVGMKTQEVNIEGKNKFNIQLKDETVGVDEVVVMGYTRQNRRDISSAVASVDMKSLESNPSASLISMLAGQAAGVQTISRSGTPGAGGGGLVIRGNTSLSASDGVEGISNPLYIVDGIPMSLQDLAGFDVSQNDFLSTLNPNEIKSINILKDAAATAIYGSRGANGVVVINTKRGVSGEPRFTSNVTYGVNLAPEKLQVYIGQAERDEKINLIGETMKNLFGDQAQIDVRNGLEIEGYMLPSVLTDKYNPAFNNAYDYQKMFYQSGITQNYDLSMDGGSEKSSYRIGLGHYDEKGVLVGYGFKRTTLNASLVNDIGKHLHNDFSARFSYLDRQGGLNSYMKAMPTNPINLPSSLFYRTPDELKRLSGELGDAYNKNKTYSLSLSDAFRIKFTDNLSLDTQGSLSLNFGSNDYFIPSTARADNKSYGQSQSSLSSTLNSNSVLNYHKEFNDHKITALAGTEINEDTQQMSWIQADNGTSDYLKVIQGFQKENINGYSNIVTTNMLSYFASGSYGYKERYQVEGIIRRDASSRFGANNKWATFPSVKAHWVFSKEPWLQGASGWLDFGKLRVSYGSSGSIAGDPLLQYNSLISIDNIGAGMNDIYRDKMDVKTYGGQTVLISDFNRVSNKGLSWSKSKEVNYGIDLELFNKRVFITGDVYSKYISGMVYTSYLPQHLGFTSIQSNLVDMINSGYELSMTGYICPRTSDFQWEWTLNLSKNNSKIAKLGNGGRDYINGDYAFVVGKPAFQYYTYEYTGTLNSFNDLPVNPVTGNALQYYGGDAGLALGLQGKIFPGMPLFTDVNGDYQIDAADYGNDKKIIPNKSPEPKIMGGLHTTIRYKNFSLRAQSSFAFGHYIFNTTLQEQLSKYDNVDQFFTSALYKTDDSKFWKSPGDKSYYPMRYISYSDGGSVRAFRKSSMFLEKGDYWSLDNVTLSYNVPKNILSNFKIRGLNFYATARNVFMWKASGVLDPRTVSKTGYYNGDGYPLSSSFIFGLQLQL